MNSDLRNKSLLLVILMVMSTTTAILAVTPTAESAGINQTTNGIITGTETWQGGHSLTGDVEIAPGAKLIIQPGTTITIPNGTFIHVKGNLCAGDTSCGASSMASNSSKITFTWTAPANESAIGGCYNLINPSNNQPLYNPDASCFEGLLIRDTIDIQETKLNYVTIQNAYGLPRFITDIGEVRWGALVLDGASPTLTETSFSNINTSSLVLLDLASPTINGGMFVVGTDARVDGLAGNAIQAYGAGSPSNPVMIDSPTFTGTSNGCSQQDGGRHVVWVQKSFVDIDHGVVTSADYGYRFTDAAGTVIANTMQVECNGIDVNGRRTVLNNDYSFTAEYNSITTTESSPFTAYDGALSTFEHNVISGSDQASGIQIVSSFPELSEVTFSNNVVGPIGGYNGIWGVGHVDIIAENNTFNDINREPFILGEYHWRDQWWQVSGPMPARGYFANNVINNVSGSCESEKVWDETFTCPAFHIFRSSATIHRNTVIGGTGDGIRAIGAILDVQDNTFTLGSQGARIVEHDDGTGNRYGSLAFFSGNTWNNVTNTYNISDSSVTVQSESIPNPPAGSNEYPILLQWNESQPYEGNNWAEQVLMPPTQMLPPRNFPLALELTNNSTVLTFANLTNMDLSKAKIITKPSIWSVQLREAALVRFRTVVNGVRVGGAQVMLEDAHGNDLYDVTTDDYGFSPWISLPIDFHLDFTGNGVNPDGFADDPNENSCYDGVDNDGDLLWDAEDPDCQQGAGVRELSKYYVTGYKFGRGHVQNNFNLTGTYDDVISLTNAAPTVTVNQNDGHSFKRVVNFSGAAWDGNIGTGIFNDDEQARWEQKGFVERIEIKTPDSSSWQDVRYGVDTSGANGEVTYNNRPYRTWYFEYDMSDQPEGDYTFEIRAYDGVDYSPIETRTIKLNTVAPVLYLDTPANGSLHSDGIIAFSGRATDPYNGVYGSDIDKIHFEIDGPNFHTVATTTGGPLWSWDWDFSGMPRNRDFWTFKIWASDSSFCRVDIGECEAVELTLDIDNTNAIPVISLLEPYNLATVQAAEDTLIMGVARDTDGEVSRVEVEILDPQDGMRELAPGAHSLVTDIAENGAWATEWDTRFLIHDFRYLVRARSFDGHDYSQWVEVEIIIDNPPDADNTPPVFDSNNWIREVIIFCEEGSQDLERCGSGGSIDLAPYFSDPDGDELHYEVYDDPEIIGNFDSDDPFSTEWDERCEELISIDVNGVATYDPVSMSFHTPDMDKWSCNGMMFIGKDSANSKAYTLTIDFIVRAVSFSVERVDGIEELATSGDTVVFTGTGRPGIEVVARVSSLRLNTTIVGDDGVWSMDIDSKKFESGLNTVTFTYDGDQAQSANGEAISVPVQVGAVDTGSGLGWILWVVIAVVALALLGGVFIFFFVEFEDEDDTGTPFAGQPEQEEDPYAWGRQNLEDDTQQQAAVQQQAAQAAQPAYPGWQWDAASNEWVPDPSTQPPKQ